MENRKVVLVTGASSGLAEPAPSTWLKKVIGFLGQVIIQK